MRRVEVWGQYGVVCVAETAEDMWTRGWGLLGRRWLEERRGLWIRPCKSVHTFFMRFTIDVVYLTRDGTVCKTSTRLRPFRFSSGGREAHSVLELPAGTLDKLDVQVGDRLWMEVVEGAGNGVVYEVGSDEG
ncbi:MAG: DUF192 domain-containing protein [SAR202 cluster bacterium]|nr:DUF192 domain-containing protein [SAR202 cluster bacterium]